HQDGFAIRQTYPPNRQISASLGNRTVEVEIQSGPSDKPYYRQMDCKLIDTDSVALKMDGNDPAIFTNPEHLTCPSKMYHP
ncbi:MAG TPA: hypothetical protein VIL63_00805, partial [Terriglobales bacterium]